MRARIGKARTAFLILKNVWSSREIGKPSKLRTVNTNVKSVLLSGSETLRTTTQATVHNLQTFTNSCQRKVLCMQWPETTRNEDRGKKANHEPVVMHLAADTTAASSHRPAEESGVGLAIPSESLPSTSPGRL